MLKDFLDQFESLQISVPGVRLPQITIEDKYKTELGLKPDCSNYELVVALCNKGLTEIGFKNDKVYEDRLNYELSMLEDMGFIDYLLIVWDVIKFCNEKDIPLGLSRGCLNYDAPVYVNNGYKKLGEVKIGDVVINSSGQEDEVINTMVYDCKEELVGFKTYKGTHSEVLMTKDHLVFAVKDPIIRNEIGEALHLKKNYVFKEIFSKDKLQWVKADELNRNDYLVRYVGRKQPIKDIESIDLAQFCSTKNTWFDNEFVYEKHVKNHFLCCKTLAKKTGICSSVVKGIKLGKNIKNKENLNKLNNYLVLNGYTLEQFKEFSPFDIKKYPRYIKIDEDFCYVLGFFIGDGWARLNGVSLGFAFNSEKDQKQLDKIIEYFNKFEVGFCKIKHKKTKLIQLMINSRIFNSIFTYLVPDKTNSKSVPDSFMNLPDNKLKSLLSGLMESDGYSCPEKISFDTTSIKLAYQARTLFELFGYSCNIIKRNQKNCHESYKVGTSDKTEHIFSSFFNDGQYVYMKIRNKFYVENSSNKVYDITVKNNPSYSTDKFIVHNSAGGSLVLMLLGITKIDPIKYNLYFERFISRSRASKVLINGETFLTGSLPDVDIDNDYYRRPEVLQYIDEKYKGRTSKILTFNTLSSKLAIKEVGKVFGLKPEEEMTAVSGLILKNHGIVEDIKKSYEEVPEFKDWCDQNKLIYEISLKLENLIKNKGVHPSGIMVSHDLLTECCPTELSSDKNIVSSYDMNWVATFSVKLDILGLRTVSIVDDVCKQLGIKYSDIDLSSEKIYRYLQDLKHPQGIFQLEALVAHKTTQKVKPKNMEELSAVLALARPGSIAFIDDYAKFTNEGVIPNFDIESDLLKKILAETGGVILYQETLLRCLKEVFQISLEDAENARRATSKKDRIKMEKFKSVLDKQGEKLNIPKSTKFFWDALIASADYSFNRCVSVDTNVFIENENGIKAKQIQIKDIKIGDEIYAYDVKNDRNHYVKVINIYHSKQDLYQITTNNGNTIKTSLKHKFLCNDLKMYPLWEILFNGHSLWTNGYEEKIVEIVDIGLQDSIDIEVDHPDHNFYADGLIVSNSHSVGYAALSAITTYLKFNHPTEFYLSLLNMSRHEPDPIGEITKISKEMKNLGLELLPPNFSKSKKDFSIEGRNIRFGLSSIKGISDKTIDKLDNFKREFANKFQLFQSAKEAGIPIGILSSIIQAGILDVTLNRTSLVYEAQLWNNLLDKEKILVLKLAKNYENSLAKTIRALNTELMDEKSKPYISDKRVATIKKRMTKYKEIANQNNESRELANWWYEKTLLGYVSSTTLRKIYGEKVADLVPICEIEEEDKCKFVGICDEDGKAMVSQTAKKSRYARMIISDETGVLRVMIFNEAMDTMKRFNKDSLPKEGDIVIVEGTKKDGGVFFASQVTVQPNRVYMKLSEIKDSSNEVELEKEGKGELV